MSWLIAIWAVVLQSLTVPLLDVSSIADARPTLVCELDMNELKGEPHRLSWSPDASLLHVRTIDGDEPHDYVVALEDRGLSLVFHEPPWATAYWMRKSDLAAPGLPSLRIEVTHTNRRTRPVPFSGGFANGGAQTFDPKNPVDAYEAEVTLRLLGEEISNWVNAVAIAGETFGWGPPGSGAIAFVDGGPITLLDQAKRKTVVPSTRGALLPAWSNDGTQLAFVQKSGRRKYRLMTAALTR